ncbi:MAG: hypothetical protein MZV64_17460 [Ignavibacteriales bacterium]|nr:hypothetical protein [Ignavibacteriales bacterium]
MQAGSQPRSGTQELLESEARRTKELEHIIEGIRGRLVRLATQRSPALPWRRHCLG